MKMATKHSAKDRMIVEDEEEEEEEEKEEDKEEKKKKEEDKEEKEEEEEEEEVEEDEKEEKENVRGLPSHLPKPFPNEPLPLSSLPPSRALPE
jgi:hypothetical protein